MGAGFQVGRFAGDVRFTSGGRRGHEFRDGLPGDAPVAPGVAGNGLDVLVKFGDVGVVDLVERTGMAAKEEEVRHR
jgi:hypothetical protein